MSEQKKLKVGDKVHVIGHPNIEGRGEVLGVEGEWYLIGSSLIPMTPVHIRNLDPVLEDERKGAPRPPIQKGETVEVLCRVVADVSYAVIEYEQLRLNSPRVRQIERRRENLGREARKS